MREESWFAPPSNRERDGEICPSLPQRSGRGGLDLSRVGQVVGGGCLELNEAGNGHTGPNCRPMAAFWSCNIDTIICWMGQRKPGTKLRNGSYRTLATRYVRIYLKKVRNQFILLTVLSKTYYITHCFLRWAFQRLNKSFNKTSKQNLHSLELAAHLFDILEEETNSTQTLTFYSN